MAASPGRAARLRSMAATIRLALKSKYRGTHAARLLAQLLPPPTSPLPPPLEVFVRQCLSRDLRCEFKAAFSRALRACGGSSVEECGLPTTMPGFRGWAAGTCSRSPSVSAASSFASERPELIPYQRWQRLPSL